MYNRVIHLVLAHKGWLITFFMAVMLSGLLSRHQPREVSFSYLQNLTRKKEVVHIAVVESETAFSKRYTAEITLSPASLKRYGWRLNNITEEGPHLVSAIGSSTEEVRKWEQGLAERDKIPFSFAKKQ